MRERFVVDEGRPNAVSDLARQVEDAFSRINWDFRSGPYTSKADFVDRMTDPECDTFDTMLDAVASRSRLKWNAISTIYHQAPDFADFRLQLIDEFGVQRTDELLRPSG